MSGGGLLGDLFGDRPVEDDEHEAWYEAWRVTVSPAVVELIERFEAYRESFTDDALEGIARVVIGGEAYAEVVAELATPGSVRRGADGRPWLDYEERELTLLDRRASIAPPRPAALPIAEELGVSSDRAEWLLDRIEVARLDRGARMMVRRHGAAATSVALFAPLDAVRPKGRELDSDAPDGRYAPTVERLLAGDYYLGSVAYALRGLLHDAATGGAPPWESSSVERESPGEHYLRLWTALRDAGIAPADATERAWRALLVHERDRASGVVAGVRPEAPLEDRSVVKLVDRADLAPRWVVEELVAAGEFVLLAAPAFAGKTPFVLDMACAVATGGELLGRSTSAGRVLYVTREASRSEIVRWVQRLGYELEDVRTNLMALSHPSWPDLSTDAGGAALVSVVERFGPFALVIVDTMGRFVFGPENAVETYGALHRYTVDRLQVLEDPPAIIFVDHLSAEDSPRPRGSTAKQDTSDAVWLMRRTKGARDADVTEHRLAHAGRVRIPRPSPIQFVRTFDAAGNCRFTPRASTTEEVDEVVEASLEAAILDSLPVASGRELERAVRSVVGDSFARDEYRRVLDRMVATDVVAEVPGPRRAVGYDLV